MTQSMTKRSGVRLTERRHRWGALLVAVLASIGVAVAGPAGAQEDGAGDDQAALLVIMDASSSMLAQDVGDGTRMDAAKQAAEEFVDELPDGLPVGLRVFGANEDDTDAEVGCTDTELVVPVQELDRPAMQEAIGAIEPRGFTPISESLRQAAQDLPESGERTIVLVSDGIDTCDPPPPCEVAEQLVDDGIDVTVQTVGFAVDDDPDAQEELACIADATGGEYREAGDATELASALTVLSARAAQTYESDATPVEGASLYRDAPVLEVGEIYSDSIVAGEARWYAYQLAEGQALRAVEAINLGGPDGGGSAEVVLHRADATSSSHTNKFIRSGTTPEIESVTPREDLAGPETYFVEVVDSSLDADVELPYELTVLVDGEAAPTEDSTTEPEATDEAEETTAPEDAEATAAPEDAEGTAAPEADTDQTGATADAVEAAQDEAAPADSGSGGTSTLLLVLVGVLVVAVAGLGTAVAVLLRRGAHSG